MSPDEILARIAEIERTIPPMSYNHKDQRDKAQRIQDLKRRYQQLRDLQAEVESLQAEVEFLRLVGDRMLADLQQHRLDDFGQIAALWNAPPERRRG